MISPFFLFKKTKKRKEKKRERCIVAGENEFCLPPVKPSAGESICWKIVRHFSRFAASLPPPPQSVKHLAPGTVATVITANNSTALECSEEIEAAMQISLRIALGMMPNRTTDGLMDD
ncbi:switch-associated protein [Trifolium repens]|nr:switch-associated protein [Trifolium repens]